jgi:transcriptional regulator with XRE-family HTH domain
MRASFEELSNLGHAVRRHRQRQCLSQEELAFRCDLHRTYLSDVERGARNLSFKSMLAIARSLGLTVSELTRNVEAKSPVERPVEQYSN